MNKLAGDEYLDFWRKRIAKGPEEVAYTGSTERESEQHADLIMREWEPILKEVEPVLAKREQPLIVELGCGWGRMATRLAKRFPEAFVHGYDICSDAIVGAMARSVEEGLEGRMHFAVESEIPESLYKHVDLVVTCTCLQHITDDHFFTRAMKSIRDAMRPLTGFALLFENCYVPRGGGSRHVRFQGSQDFLRWFEKPEGEYEYFWALDRTVVDHGEPHQAMLIRRHQIKTR